MQDQEASLMEQDSHGHSQHYKPDGLLIYTSSWLDNDFLSVPHLKCADVVPKETSIRRGDADTIVGGGSLR
jgi:hypothetical protein